MVRGGLPPHLLAGTAPQSKKERYLLRTGKTPGKSGKRERAILVMREQKQRRLAEAAKAEPSSSGASASTSGQCSGQSSSNPKAAITSEAAGTSLRRQYNEQEQQKAQREAAATNVETPAAKSYLELLRAEIKGGGSGTS